MRMSYHISCTIGRTVHVREIVNKKKKKKIFLFFITSWGWALKVCSTRYRVPDSIQGEIETAGKEATDAANSTMKHLVR